LVLSTREYLSEVITLEIKNLSFSFKDRKILHNISFETSPGKIYGLFGPNGSGKTTLFNLISGLYRPNAGIIRYYGICPKRMEPLGIARLGNGLARTFQDPVVINDLSVEENVLLAYRLPQEGFISLLYRGARSFNQERIALTEVQCWLAHFKLTAKKNMPAGELSYGERRLVANITAILMGSGILLLDEPFANLNVLMIQKLKGWLRKIALEEKRTILIIEHSPDNLYDFVDVLLRIKGYEIDSIQNTGDIDFVKKLISRSTLLYG